MLAVGYEINVDGAVYTTQNCSYDVTLLVSAIADHNIKVRAKDSGNYKASEYASAIYATTAEITSPVLGLLQGHADLRAKAFQAFLPIDVHTPPDGHLPEGHLFNHGGAMGEMVLQDAPG